MPSVSKKQHNLMAAVANNPAFAKKTGIPQSVGAEFMKADKGRRFGSGSRADAQSINKPKTNQGKQEFFSKGGDTMASKMNPVATPMENFFFSAISSARSRPSRHSITM